MLVQMGASRAEDNFYIVPTADVRKAIDARRKSWLAKSRRDGAPRKDIGMWVLRLQDRRDGEDEPGYGLERKWSAYHDGWEILESIESMNEPDETTASRAKMIERLEARWRSLTRR